MTSISAGHIILTPTQPVGSGRPQRGSNPRPPDQESRVLPTERPHPPGGGGNLLKRKEKMLSLLNRTTEPLEMYNSLKKSIFINLIISV